MIEGLKVTVQGKELADMCMARADYHQQRAKTYASQVASLNESRIPEMTNVSNDPRRSLREKQESHEASAGEMAFIAKHIIPAESYMLDGSDLVKLGVAHRGW